MPVNFDNIFFHPSRFAIENVRDSARLPHGDLRHIYSPKTGRIPFELNEAAFNVLPNTKAEIIEEDTKYKQCAQHIAEHFSDKKTYYIVDVGLAHLVGIADALMKSGIDCSFVIRGEVNARFKNALRYWAESFDEAKRQLTEPVGYATLIDAHRSCTIDPNFHLPSLQKLKELDIERVIKLDEGNFGHWRKFSLPKDAEGYRKVLEEADINEMVTYGIRYDWAK